MGFWPIRARAESYLYYKRKWRCCCCLFCHIYLRFILPFCGNNTGNKICSHTIQLTWKTVIAHTNMVEMSWVENTKSTTNKSKDSHSHETRPKTNEKCNFWRLRSELVRNYFSDCEIKAFLISAACMYNCKMFHVIDFVSFPRDLVLRH